MSASSWGRAAAVYLDRRVVAMLFLGFSSGLPLALTGATLSVWLREEGVSVAAIGLFSLVSLPYALKFCWAPLIDRLTLPVISRAFGRRRGWALVSQTALALALVGLGAADPVADLGAVAALAVVVAFFSASQDIVIDAYRVERLEVDQQAAGAASYVLGYRFGMLASGAGALFLAAATDWPTAYLGMAALVSVGMLTILLVKEPTPIRSADAIEREERAAAWLAARPHLAGWQARFLAWLFGAVVAPFAQFATRPSWAAVLLFIALYKLGDVMAGLMASPMYVDLGFTKEQIAGVVKVFGLWAVIAGTIIGGVLVSKVGVLRGLLVGGVLQMISNLGFALLAMHGEPDVTWLAAVIAVENVCGGIATAAFVAYLSSLCDASYTATQYALLSSFYKLGGDLFGATSGFLAEALGWVQFFLASTLGAVPALLVLLWLIGRARNPAPRPAAAPESA